MKAVNTQTRAPYAFGGTLTGGDTQQWANLLDDIRQLLQPARCDKTQALIEAYLSGDMNVVNEVMEEAMAGDTALMSRFQDIAITRRNNHMTERIQALRREQPSTVFFVAVGTAHYAGPTGIVAQLQKAGLKVTRVGS